MVEDKIKAALIEEFKAIPPREELEKMYTFSERHNKMMEALFAEMRRRERFERYFRGVKKIAVIMLALLGCAFVSLKVIPTVYAYVEAWITENADDRLIFKDKDMEEDRGEKEDLRFELGYVPEGYELVGETSGRIDTHTIVYENKEEELLQLKSYKNFGENQISVDIETAFVEDIKVNGIQYYVFENNDGIVIITWEEREILFRLKGVLKKKEMLNIATSIRIIECE